MPTSSSSADHMANSTAARLNIDYLLDPQAIAQEDIQDVMEGLQKVPKSIPPRYFYDAKGSQLFEQICKLPEYYPTRTEASILQQYAPTIVKRTQAQELIELGSGSSTKTRYLLDTYQDLSIFLYYSPVDVSGSILKSSAQELLADYTQLKIQGKVATYAQALEQLGSYSSGRKLIAFLGSSIGNFDPLECDRLMAQLTAAMAPGDYFLLGVDLQKPASILEAAYNDAQGVTAAFNLNMLQHLNNRFAGDFDPSLFKHQAIYNPQDHQIEMYLTSQQNQTVTLQKLDLTIELQQGERILTEISRKFDLDQMKNYLGDWQLQTINVYSDQQQWFGLILCQLNL